MSNPILVCKDCHSPTVHAFDQNVKATPDNRQKVSYWHHIHRCTVCGVRRGYGLESTRKTTEVN